MLHCLHALLCMIYWVRSVAPWIGLYSKTSTGGIAILFLCHSTGETRVSVNVVEWVRAALISKRAEVTLLHSSSGPLSLIANTVSVCHWHANHPCMIILMLQQSISDGNIHTVLLLLSWRCPSKWLLSAVCFVLQKVVWSMPCLYVGHASRHLFGLTWCNSH